MKINGQFVQRERECHFGENASLAFLLILKKDSSLCSITGTPSIYLSLTLSISLSLSLSLSLYLSISVPNTLHFLPKNYTLSPSLFLWHKFVRSSHHPLFTNREHFTKDITHLPTTLSNKYISVCLSLSLSLSHTHTHPCTFILALYTSLSHFHVCYIAPSNNHCTLAHMPNNLKFTLLLKCPKYSLHFQVL